MGIPKIIELLGTTINWPLVFALAIYCTHDIIKRVQEERQGKEKEATIRKSLDIIGSAVEGSLKGIRDNISNLSQNITSLIQKIAPLVTFVKSQMRNTS